MSKIELTPTHLLVKLTPAEKIFALHGDFKIPAALIRGAEITEKNVWKTFGNRSPGTALPGLLIYGHYWLRSPIKGEPKIWTFGLWRSKLPTISITLATVKGKGGNRFSRLVISHPDAVALADQINDAIVAC
jgi:hypothetical protein